MANYKTRKVKQIAATAIWLIAVVVLVSIPGLYLKNRKSSDSRSILDYGTPVWLAIPVSIHTHEC